MSKKKLPQFYLIEPNMDLILGPYDSTQAALNIGAEDIVFNHPDVEEADWLLVSLVGNVEQRLSVVLSEED